MTLLILLAILLGSYLLLRLVPGPFNVADSSRRGQVSLALLFVVTGMGHFVQTEQMVQMLPAWVPARTEFIWLSGLFEWLLAAGLFIPRYSRLAGLCAIAFLVFVFPGNIYAAINRVDMGGHAAGPAYLLVRGPFQLLLIWWAYWFAVRPMPRHS
jgi:uncharacterized membrane protein